MEEVTVKFEAQEPALPSRDIVYGQTSLNTGERFLYAFTRDQSNCSNGPLGKQIMQLRPDLDRRAERQN